MTRVGKNMSESVLLTLIGGLITLVVTLISTWAQLKKMREELAQKQRLDNQVREDGETERDARAAKDMGDTLTVVLKPLREEISTLHEQLSVANQKIEHLTGLVEEYSRGLDLLIEQIRKDNKVPVYTKKTVQEHKSHNHIKE